jgi:pilus assembly protein CpaC
MSAHDLVAGKAKPGAPADQPDGDGPPAKAPALPGPVPVPGNPGLRMPLTPTPHFTPVAGQYIQQVSGPDNVLEVIVGRVQIFNLVKAPARIQVGDETVANYALLSPCELSLQGMRVGTTVLNIWFSEQDHQKPKLISFLVRVLPDPDARNRLERAYKNLENEINRAFPNSRVVLSLVGDKLAVFGQARDIAEANFIMRMVQANVLPEAADSPDLGRPPSADPSTYYKYTNVFHRNVVNMLRVIGEQQVTLQVQVVEVDRAAARSVGLNFGILRNTGSFFIGGTTGNLAQTRSFGGFAPFNAGFRTTNTSLTGLGGLPNLPVALDFGQIQLAIVALQSLSYARYLAEPNLTAINGQTAAFQVGSLLPVPVVSGGLASSNLQGVNFIPTGVQLAFTPYITDRDRVRLTISAEISDRDLNVAPTIIDGAAIPSLVTRNFQTTVELREGQTLAVAGLIENKIDADANRLPFLGCVPLLNRIAGFDTIGNREKELVILVTPRLVRPLECKEVPPPPGMEILEPTDLEFYVLGRLESHTGFDYRSPVRTDCSRKNEQYRYLEQNLLIGPSGPSMDLPPGPPMPIPGGPEHGVMPGDAPMMVPGGPESAGMMGPGGPPPGNPLVLPPGKVPAPKQDS